MHRRALHILAMVLLALAATIGFGSAAMAEPAPEPPAPPPTIADDFFPESANLSDCVGFVERPGCGAEGRGGTGQTLAFIALATGLTIIFWRVTVGVRRTRRAQTNDVATDRQS